MAVGVRTPSDPAKSVSDARPAAGSAVKVWVAVASLLLTMWPDVPASAAGPIVTETRVSQGSDDAEEDASGSVNTSSSDLELTFDDSDQTIGIRFDAPSIPQGASVTSAWIQFKADEATSGPTQLLIQAEAADDAATFVSSDFDISSRPTTSASVEWIPPAWTSVGDAGPDQDAGPPPTAQAQVGSRR